MEVNANKNLSTICVDSKSVASEFNVISSCNKSLVNKPANVAASCHMLEKSNQRKINRSIKNLSESSLEYSAAAQLADSSMNASDRWLCDVIDGSMKAMNPMERPDFDPATQNVHKNQSRLRSVSGIAMKISDLFTSHRIHSLLTGDLESIANPLSERGTGARFSQELIPSCASRESTSSILSSSALLYCVWENNIPYFVFVVNDNGGEVYVASPLKTKPFFDKFLDYIYVFHSCKVSRKKSKNAVSSSSLAGKMKVSSSVCVGSNKSKYMETEFVLFGANEECFTEKEKSSINLKKSNQIPKKMTEIFRTNHSQYIAGEPNHKFMDLLHNFPRELQITGESVTGKHFSSYLSPNLELVAMIVRDYGCSPSKGKYFGGWGIKFLEQTEADGTTTQEVSLSSPESCKERSKKTEKDVTVLFPAGFHGLPVTGAGHPSTLIERWKSNGHCDCGGWDIGCPLKVMNNHSISSTQNKKMEENCQPLELFLEGSEHNEPALEMLNAGKDIKLHGGELNCQLLEQISNEEGCVNYGFSSMCEAPVQESSFYANSSIL